MKKILLSSSVLFAIVASACDSSSLPTLPFETDSARDSAATDGGIPMDGSSRSDAKADSSAMDASAVDSSPMDSSAVDSSPVDGALPDAAADGAVADSGPGDDSICPAATSALGVSAIQGRASTDQRTLLGNILCEGTPSLGNSDGTPDNWHRFAAPQAGFYSFRLRSPRPTEPAMATWKMQLWGLTSCALPTTNGRVELDTCYSNEYVKGVSAVFNSPSATGELETTLTMYLRAQEEVVLMVNGEVPGSVRRGAYDYQIDIAFDATAAAQADLARFDQAGFQAIARWMQADRFLYEGEIIPPPDLLLSNPCRTQHLSSSEVGRTFLRCASQALDAFVPTQESSVSLSELNELRANLEECNAPAASTLAAYRSCLVGPAKTCPAASTAQVGPGIVRGETSGNDLNLEPYQRFDDICETAFPCYTYDASGEYTLMDGVCYGNTAVSISGSDQVHAFRASTAGRYRFSVRTSPPQVAHRNWYRDLRQVVVSVDRACRIGRSSNTCDSLGSPSIYDGSGFDWRGSNSREEPDSSWDATNMQVAIDDVILAAGELVYVNIDTRSASTHPQWSYELEITHEP